jgi:hypothetical protein
LLRRGAQDPFRQPVSVFELLPSLEYAIDRLVQDLATREQLSQADVDVR